MNRIKYKVCLRKKKFGSHDSAGIYLAKLKDKGLLDDKLVPYKCVWCQGWHLGHEPDDEEKKELSRLERLRDIQEDKARKR